MMWQSSTSGRTDLGPHGSDTVLVLGAGASAHLGYPLGATLCENIIKNTDDTKGSSFRELVEMGFAEKVIGEFSDQLAKALPSTIDEFLSYRLELVDIGRAAIAQELIRYEDASLLRRRAGNWYAMLRDHIKEAIDTNRSCPLVVTFNYDRSLDKLLSDFVKSMYPTKVQVLHDVMRVFHVHGLLGDLDHEAGSRPYCSQATPAEIRAASQGIRVPAELENNYGQEMVVAQNAIRNARRVIFLGFGFDGTNVDRLRLGDWRNDTTKYCGTAYRLSPARRQQLLDESGGRLTLGGADTTILDYVGGLSFANVAD